MGEGLLRKGTKSRAGEQTLTVAVDRGYRDPANVRRELREARGTKTVAWITSHTFRKTAATIVDEATLSARLVADQLGHSHPSMTPDAYLARVRGGLPGGARAGGRGERHGAQRGKRVAKVWATKKVRPRDAA